MNITNTDIIKYYTEILNEIPADQKVAYLSDLMTELEIDIISTMDAG